MKNHLSLIPRFLYEVENETRFSKSKFWALIAGLNSLKDVKFPFALVSRISRTWPNIIFSIIRCTWKCLWYQAYYVKGHLALIPSVVLRLLNHPIDFLINCQLGDWLSFSYWSYYYSVAAYINKTAHFIIFSWYEIVRNRFSYGQKQVVEKGIAF